MLVCPYINSFVNSIKSPKSFGGRFHFHQTAMTLILKAASQTSQAVTILKFRPHLNGSCVPAACRLWLQVRYSLPTTIRQSPFDILTSKGLRDLLSPQYSSSRPFRTFGVLQSTYHNTLRLTATMKVYYIGVRSLSTSIPTCGVLM